MRVVDSKKMYCHNGSEENYFTSPKMPVKDHIQGLKSTKTSFKPGSSIMDNVHISRYRRRLKKY